MVVGALRFALARRRSLSERVQVALAVHGDFAARSVLAGAATCAKGAPRVVLTGARRCVVWFSPVVVAPHAPRVVCLYT